MMRLRASRPTRWGLCAAVCLAAVGAQTPNPSAAKFNSMIAAETALVEAVWGNSEEYITHSRSRVPPYHFDAATGASGPVRVDISVLVEKIKIDTVSQVATIKWWLRQSWKDQRLAWNTAEYTYGKGDQTGFVGSVNRRPGPEGGTWTPDLVLWESHFDGTQSTAVFAEQPPSMTISADGTVFWSVPQQVNLNMKPRMDMRRFPFDKQTVRFTLGPWTNDKAHQDTRVPGDAGDGKFETKEFLALLGVDGHGDASSYDIKLKNAHEKEGGMFVGTEEWSFVKTEVSRNEDTFPCCTAPYVTIVGEITLRREPRYYLRYGVLPEMVMTLVGIIAHAFRGHTASSVTFICGTGFTVILTLTAHIVFLLDRLPVIRTESFMEFVFLWSLAISSVSTCFTLYLFKKTEWREEHDETAMKLKRHKRFRKWADLSERGKRAMFYWMLLDQLIFPAMAITYVVGLFARAHVAGCTSGPETVDTHSDGCMHNFMWLELMMGIAGAIVVFLAAFYDLWKSAEMSHAPHTPLKHRFKQWMAPKLGLAIPDDPTESQNVSGYNGSENLYYNGDLVHAGAATNQIPAFEAAGPILPQSGLLPPARSFGQYGHKLPQRDSLIPYPNPIV